MNDGSAGDSLATWVAPSERSLRTGTRDRNASGKDPGGSSWLR